MPKTPRHTLIWSNDPQRYELQLTTMHENMQPGTMKLYLATSDLEAAYNELKAKGASVNEVKDDLYGPGSGVKWFEISDPDGNRWLVVQA